MSPVNGIDLSSVKNKAAWLIKMRFGAEINLPRPFFRFLPGPDSKASRQGRVDLVRFLWRHAALHG